MLEEFSNYLCSRIALGDTVVYNLSGNLAIGKIVRIENKVVTRWGRARLLWRIYIEYVSSSMGFPSGHISIITNTEGVYKL
jgi:hypothetical protein